MRKIVVVILCFFAVASALAQELVWNVDFSTVVNNREGGDELRPDQTFIFTRLNPEIGLQFRFDGATHSLKGGVDWYQPICNNCEGHKIVPTLYYQYRDKHFTASLGAIPRTLLIDHAPRFLWSDSMAYVQPTIRGALVQYRKKGGTHAELMIDWRQIQSETRREAFTVYFNSKFRLRKGLWMGGTLQYNHLAKRKNAPESEGVNDDLSINPMLGHDWQFGKQQELKVKAGAIINLERNRSDDKWLSPCGFTATMQGRWKWFEAEESVFAGSDLFPLWDHFGPELNLGDTYYKSKFYSRTDVRAHLVQNAFVDLTAGLTFHATDKITGFWQQISCRVYIGQNIWKNRRSKKRLRTPLLQSNY